VEVGLEKLAVFVAYFFIGWYLEVDAIGILKIFLSEYDVDKFDGGDTQQPSGHRNLYEYPPPVDTTQ